MQQAEHRSITMTKTGFVVSLLLAAISGGLLVALLAPAQKQSLTLPAEALPEPATVIEKKASPEKPARTVKKLKTQQVQPADKANTFVIKGLISTAGEPWSANLIRVKLLWLKNKNEQQFLIGHESALVQMTQQGLAYQFILKAQPAAYVNFNSGVEGNIARIIAFVDQQQDGQLTPKKDKIIAVSKEVLRYRTGRYDKTILNDIQKRNIRKAGKGYVFIRNEPDDKGNMDWRVVADRSPVRLDLNASETSLPGMYNTFLKLQ